jgi:hypothetical protein
MAMTCNFTQKILSELKRGHKVSALTCAHWPDFPSTKLTSRISDLRKKFKIKGVWIKSKTGKRFMQYSMKVTK